MPILEGKTWRPVKEFFYLATAMTCRNCQATFEAQRACPACTSDAIQSTETYCRGMGEQRQRQQFLADAGRELVDLHAEVNA